MIKNIKNKVILKPIFKSSKYINLVGESMYGGGTKASRGEVFSADKETGLKEGDKVFFRNTHDIRRITDGAHKYLIVPEDNILATFK